MLIFSFTRHSRNGTKKKKKKSQEPTIQEEDEEAHSTSSSDDTDGLSATTEGTNATATNDLRNKVVDQEHMVARALEESLGLAGDDPDIAEAKQRLLASKILSPDLFEVPSSDEISESDIGAYLDDGSFESSTDLKDSSVTEGNSTHEHDVDEELGKAPESPYDPQMGIYSSKSFHEEDIGTPNENTGLLSQSSESAQKLRPSIFTTVASLAETEEKGEAEETREKIF